MEPEWVLAMERGVPSAGRLSKSGALGGVLGPKSSSRGEKNPYAKTTAYIKAEGRAVARQWGGHVPSSRSRSGR